MLNRHRYTGSVKHSEIENKLLVKDIIPLIASPEYSHLCDAGYDPSSVPDGDFPPPGSGPEPVLARHKETTARTTHLFPP